MQPSPEIILTSEQLRLLDALHGRDFLCLHDYSPEEIAGLLALAGVLKKTKTKRCNALANKQLACIFTKPSTRTRVSFEVGIKKLGGSAVILSATDSQINRGEPIADMARVLSRYVDGIMIRTFAHSDVEELAEYSTVPVINGLTDDFHPCQVMADLLTIQERLGQLAGKHLVYIGDGNNMAHSLLFAGAKTGMHVTICCPVGYAPSSEILRQAQEDALPGTKLEIRHDDLAAVAGADVLYTDVWASMGQEEEKEVRSKVFARYQINQDVLAQAAPDCMVLHCLPAHRGEEITADVLEAHADEIFDQAENRLHAQNAIMLALMGSPYAVVA
ncbi:MAG TPA: ornithine carbamoyltransferase [Firmicutes bacterium]|jgi:ornithine carbamoyltransferase|nr:ornithine carbamoyltransferase [Bacillota bacterium]